MNKVTFDISTSVTFQNGTTLQEMVSVLQNFTNKYLYIKNNKLYSVSSMSDLKSEYRLIGYDCGFQLMCPDMRTMIYCFRKDFADHLSSIQNNIIVPELPNRSDTVNDYLPQARSGQNVVKICTTTPPFPDKDLGDIPRANPLDEYNRRLVGLMTKKEKQIHELNNKQEGFGGDDNNTVIETKTIEPDELEQMGQLFGSNNNNKDNDNKELLRPSKKPKKEQSKKTYPEKKITRRRVQAKELPKIPDIPDSTDIAYQSRVNGTSALVAAVRQKRAIAKSRGSSNENLAGKTSHVYQILQDNKVSKTQAEQTQAKQNQVKCKNTSIECSYKSQAKNQSCKNNDQDICSVHAIKKDINTSDSEKESDEDIPEIQLPVFKNVHREFKENVKLSSLPDNLQSIIIKTVIDMANNLSPVGSFVYDGVTVNIIVDENNVVNIYDRENELALPRLIPSRYTNDSIVYNGDSGNLPISQFTVHQNEYAVELAQVNFVEDIGIPAGPISEDSVKMIHDIYGTTKNDIINEIRTVFSNNPDLTFAEGNIINSNINNNQIRILVTYFQALNTKEKPEKFTSLVLSECHTLLYYHSDLID